MRTNIYILFVVFAMLFGYTEVKAGSCSPSTTNANCAAAVTLTPGAACVNGTTCSGGAQVASSCLFAGSECSWYQFTATSTDMYVSIDVLTTDGCHISSNVYEATGSCVGTEISCLFGTPLDDMHILSGLTPTNVYYVQVCYSPGGPCGNGGEATYCINVDDVDPPCDQCSTPCGDALGYATTPLVATVVGDCVTPTFSPELQPGSTNTFCYEFTATATSVDFNVIITSNCGAGNVTNFSWSLYNYPSCGAAIQTGNLASLTFTGLTVNNDYVFCYTFDVPAACTHSQHCPFFVGATTPLPINLLNFDAVVDNKNQVNLEWVTATEINNDYFTIERTRDGNVYEVVGIVDGAGNSTMVKDYNLIDDQPYTGTSYYRLKQTDYDNNYTYSRLVAVQIKANFDELNVYPNPVTGNAQLTFEMNATGNVAVDVFDVSGRLVITKNIRTNKGQNNVPLPTDELTRGMYFLTVRNGSEKTTVKFIKD